MTSDFVVSFCTRLCCWSIVLDYSKIRRERSSGTSLSIHPSHSSVHVHVLVVVCTCINRTAVLHYDECFSLLSVLGEFFSAVILSRSPASHHL